MSVDCPTAAAACFSGIERGRSGRARRAIPVAIAPEVTSTTSRPPSARAPAMSAASAAIRRRSGPVDPVVIWPVPTFTTSRRTRPS